MPKVQKSPIRLYFVLQESQETDGNQKPESECKACGLRMKGNHASNMERHLRRSHPAIYEKFLELKHKTLSPTNGDFEQLNPQQLLEDYGIQHVDQMNNILKGMKPSEVNKKPASSSVRKITKKSDIIDACVELVTVNGRPFSLMNDSGFRTLIEPVRSKICSSLVIDENSVKRFVTEKALKLRMKIMEELKDAVLCLKLDCVTHCNRSFLGVVVQRYADEEMKLYVLSVVEINVRQDTNELANIIVNELNRFGIRMNQVYCVSIDGGTNFVDPIDAEPTDVESNSEGGSAVDVDVIEESDSLVKEEAEASIQVITVYNECEDDSDDLDSNTMDIILEKLHASIKEYSDTIVKVQESRCISHILQSTVTDFFKGHPEVTEVIKEARSIVKKLNIPNASNILKRLKISVPTLDHGAKWKSTYLMLEKLLKMQNLCSSLSIVDENSEIWTQVEELVHTLKACKLVSDILESEQLVISDVYKLWYNCILEISKLNTTMASILVQHMREKQDLLFEDISFLSAIFLDPRFNNMVLSETQKTEAVKHLETLHEQLILQTTPTKSPENLVIPDAGQNFASENNAEEDELEKIFKEHEKVNSKRSKEDKRSNIELALRNFCENEPRLKTTENIMNFWERKKIQYPDIYNLVSVALAVPATQKTVNGLISEIRYILRMDKTNMSVPLYNNVILIRANAEMALV